MHTIQFKFEWDGFNQCFTELIAASSPLSKSSCANIPALHFSHIHPQNDMPSMYAIEPILSDYYMPRCKLFCQYSNATQFSNQLNFIVTHLSYSNTIVQQNNIDDELKHNASTTSYYHSIYVTNGTGSLIGFPNGSQFLFHSKVYSTKR